jgi:hypothetical protein
VREKTRDELQDGPGDRESHPERQAEQEVFPKLCHKSPFQVYRAIHLTNISSHLWKWRILGEIGAFTVFFGSDEDAGY